MTRIGTVISLPDVALAELAGTALDFAWIDLEHGALSLRDAQALAIALAAAGCEAHVRLPSAGSELLGPVLDAGVDGVVAPRVDDAQTARAMVRRLRYPPGGTRGFGPRRAGAYGRAPSDEVAVTVQIESPAGVEAAEEIAAVDGIDAIVLGCSDLSLVLESPHQLGAAADRVAGAAAAAGRRFGLAAGGAVEDVAALAAGRADHIVFSADVRLYSGAVDAAMDTLTAALEGARAAA